MVLSNESLKGLFGSQLEHWPQAKNNYEVLKKVEYRSVGVNGFNAKIQFNPARIVSSLASVDQNSIMRRPCFLCKENRPSVQEGLDFVSKQGNEYVLLVNPFPIAPEHYTISVKVHSKQSILGKVEDMLEVAEMLDNYVVLYNGPKSGASAPDHHHFQVITKGFLPIEDSISEISKTEFLSTGKTNAYFLNEFIKGGVYLRSSSLGESIEYFSKIIDVLGCQKEDYEARMNIVSWIEGGYYNIFIAPRTNHRPSCYFLEGDKKILISPGAVDLAGVFIIPLESDFNKIDTSDLEKILTEVCLDESEQIELFFNLKQKFNKAQPQISVGIILDEVIEVNFGKKREVFKYKRGRIEWNNRLYDDLSFSPEQIQSDSFELIGVTIGIGFHWERKENQMFKGGLAIIVEGDKLRAINKVGLEDYLISVISSEMSATASTEFLKAHSVISRSWLLAQISKNEKIVDSSENYQTISEDQTRRIKWYDREDHQTFDVCADDHCQRYQGITRASSDKVSEVIYQTWGKVLSFDGKICDARFSKCCGGVMEEFATCWEDSAHPYLQAKRDSDLVSFPDLKLEENARGWILSSPKSYCDTRDENILTQVLNDYDRETHDFYRWKVEYSQEEISSLLSVKSGIDFGDILDLIPIKRGASGRIYELQIVGTKKTFNVGKELEIRKFLSKTHLYSSAFVINKSGDLDGVPTSFKLEGAGWGHGVGLCQVGAAVMGENGFSYEDILKHYYIRAEIIKKY